MNYLSEVQTVFRHAIRLHSSLRLCVVNYSKVTGSKDDDFVYDDDADAVKVSEVLVDEEDVVEREREIQRMRNKSRLNKTHRNLMFKLPKPEEEYKWDKTLYFTRRQYAKYGSQTGIDPRLCFPTPEERADREEYNRVAYPYTIQQMVEMNQQVKMEKEAAVIEREKKIAQNLSKLDKWMDDLNKRVAQKEQEAKKAKSKREALLEDIRQEFGFKIDFKDPRFQALMEKKELEAKKAKKAEKKKQREEQLIQKLKEQAEETMEKNKKDDDKTKQAAKSTGDSKAKSKENAKDDSGSSSDSDSDSDDEKNKNKK